MAKGERRWDELPSIQVTTNASSEPVVDLWGYHPRWFAADFQAGPIGEVFMAIDPKVIDQLNRIEAMLKTLIDRAVH